MRSNDFHHSLENDHFSMIPQLRRHPDLVPETVSHPGKLLTHGGPVQEVALRSRRESPRAHIRGGSPQRRPSPRPRPWQPCHTITEDPGNGDPLRDANSTLAKVKLKSKIYCSTSSCVRQEDTPDLTGVKTSRGVPLEERGTFHIRPQITSQPLHVNLPVFT